MKRGREGKARVCFDTFCDTLTNEGSKTGIEREAAFVQYLKLTAPFAALGKNLRWNFVTWFTFVEINNGV